MENKKRRKLTDLKINAIAFVDRGANRRDFAIYKRAKISKPFPGEHAARLRDPNDFNPDTFRRVNGGTIFGSKDVPETISIIWGKLKGSDAPGDNPIPQALRFPVENWTVAEARQWLTESNITFTLFEPAEEKKMDAKKNAAHKDGGEDIFLVKEEKNVVEQIKEALSKAEPKSIKKEDAEALIEALRQVAGIEKEETKKDAHAIQAIIDLLADSPTPEKVAQAVAMLRAMMEGAQMPAKAESNLAEGSELFEKAFKLLYAFEKEDKVALAKAGRKISTANEAHLVNAFKAFVGMIKSLLGDEGVQKSFDSVAEDFERAKKEAAKDEIKKALLSEEGNKLTEEEAGTVASLYLEEQLTA